MKQLTKRKTMSQEQPTEEQPLPHPKTTKQEAEGPPPREVSRLGTWDYYPPARPPAQVPALPLKQASAIGMTSRGTATR